jgi:ABC-type transport system involved in multi-copper enzyme maturation permease subunit
MNWRAIRAIMRKDLRVVLKNPNVVLPIILLPAILLIVLPLIFGIVLRTIDLNDPSMRDFQDMLRLIPPQLLADFGTLDQVGTLLIYVLVYMFAPFFLMMPILTSTVIAADSFAGEKERKTLEAILYTPTSDRELFVAKTLAPLLMSVIVSLLAFALYSVVVNLLAAPVIGSFFFPNMMWLVLVFWVAPAAAGLGISVMVIVSARTATFQGAYQTGSMLVLPVVLLLIGQFTGILILSPALATGIGTVLWALVLVLIRFGSRSFQRGEIIAQL